MKIKIAFIWLKWSIRTVRRWGFSFKVRQYLQQGVAAFQEKVFFSLEDKAETEENFHMYLRSLFKKRFSITAFSTLKELNFVIDTSMPTTEIQTPVNPLSLESPWSQKQFFHWLGMPQVYI